MKIISSIWGKLDRSGLLRWIPDKEYLKIDFRMSLGTKLDLKSPKTFNEKLQWIKLYDRKPVYTQMVDKAQAKDYVANLIGDNCIVPTLGVWDSFDDIDFDKLPNRFVMKCTHDSGGVFICKDKEKIDKAFLRRKMEKSLDTSYYWLGREWPYKNVKPRIIIEEFLEDNLKDYKIFCFNGIPKMILVCSNRYEKGGLKEDFFDLNWNHLPVERKAHSNSEETIKAPSNLKQMIEYATQISSETLFSRIDFYEIGDRIYFGEITFFPSGGTGAFVPEEWDRIIGDWLDLKTTR